MSTPCSFTEPITEQQRQECLNYCIGSELNPNSTAWFSRWNNQQGGCITAINENMFNDPVINVGKGEPISAIYYTDIDGFEWSQQLMSEVFNKYRTQGWNVATIPGFQGYNDFQNVMFDICRSSPGLCSNNLFNICAQETTESLQVNQEKVPWCGCYMPNEEYQSYADRYELPKQCTPTCARHSNILLVGPDQISIVNCQQDACIIDNVTINLAQSSGGINFAQFCGGCSGSSAVTQGIRQQPSSSCLCIISNLTIDDVNTEIGGGLNIAQSCGQEQCYSTDEEGRSVRVSCTNPNDRFPDETQEQREESFRDGLVVISIILVVIIVLIILSFL